jgi:hypothetical protein
MVASAVATACSGCGGAVGAFAGQTFFFISTDFFLDLENVSLFFVFPTMIKPIFE